MVKKFDKLDTVHLDVTGRCNLSCLYCYRSEFNTESWISQELSFDKWCDIIRECYDVTCRDFSFSGGEPFLREDFLSILEYCSSLGVRRIAVFSNGTMITNPKLEALKRIKPKVEFRVSLDGFSGNDVVRVGSKYENIISRIRKLRQNEHPVVINTMITNFNIHDLKGLYKQLVELDVQKWQIDIPFCQGRYQQNQDVLRVNFERVFKVLADILQIYLSDAHEPFSLDIVNVFKTKMLKEARFFAFAKEDNPCAYMQNGITVCPNGDVTWCPSLNIKLGNLTSDTVKEVLASKERKLFADMSLDKIKKCNDCRYLPICGGGCRADALYLTGDLWSPDPVACECMLLFEKWVLPVFPDELYNQVNSLLR